VPSEQTAPSWFSNYHRTRGIVSYDGFYVPKESLTRSNKQLVAIGSLKPIQKQFVGTLVDTEVAVGYFLRNTNATGKTWVAYIAVKMKYGGDLVYLAELISRLPPSRGWYANTIKHSLDRRWSLNIQGVVAYTLVREIRPYLHNEKSIIEVDCVLTHGPVTNGEGPHPFVQCGGRHIRRGVWYWPQIDEENESENGCPQRINSRRRTGGSMANQPEHEEHVEMQPREPNTIYVGKKPTNE